MERSLKRPADAAFLPSASTSTSERGSAVDLVSLEDDALARVFRLVGDPKSLARLSLVSRRWRDALATCGAWRMLCLELGRAPRMPRKPWRDIHLDALRRRIEDDRYAHELLMLRVTSKPGRSAEAWRLGKRADASGMGAMRLDRPVSLRRALERQPRLDVNHRSATYGGRTLLGIAARLGSLLCAKELVNVFDADVDARDDEGWSPLMEAAFRGNEALACCLLEAGATSAGVAGARPDAIVLVGVGVTRRGEVGNRVAKRDGDGAARDAAEWANARGNERIAEMIERHRRGEPLLAGFLAEGQRLVKTNVTPFSI
jgi:hypothetical protein